MHRALFAAATIIAICGVLWSGKGRADEAVKPPGTPPKAAPAWCASELEVLPGEVCHFSPPEEKLTSPRTLVIYLHGVILPNTEWQWAPERAMVRAARVHGFSVITPRGRQGIGPGKMKNWWAWPTSAANQRRVEDSLVSEWMQTKDLLEKRNGKPFERVYVFGFSNGAYYASSLALRGKLPVNGYAVFAGGSAGHGRKKKAAKVTNRPPIYVGYGMRDSTWRDGQRLGKALRSLSWPVKVKGRARVGHLMTDSQIREAIEFFRKQ